MRTAASSSGLNLQVLHEIPNDDNLRAAWNGLVGSVESPQVFYTYEWALAVSHAYGTVLRPLLILGYRDSALVGVAALAANAARNEVSFLCSTTADYCDFISAPRDQKEFIRAVFDTLHDVRIRTVVLANLPADSSTAHVLGSTARRCGYGQFSRAAYNCAQIVFHSAEERSAVNEKLLKKEAARRHMRQLGEFEIEHLQNWADIDRAFAEFSQAHVGRFLSTGRISNLARPERIFFLRELAYLLCQSGGGVTLSRMLVKGRPAAWNYGFKYAGSWFWYHPTFDTEYQRYSPGFSLLTKIIQTACDEADIRVVDLGLGAESYKDRLASHSRQTLHVTLSASAITLAAAAMRFFGSEALQAKPEVDAAARRFASNALRVKGTVQRDGWAHSIIRMFRYIRGPLDSTDEVFFFEFEGSPPPHPVTTSLHTANLNLFARAAMQYSDDEETLNYLLRAAKRLSSRGRGFVLLNGDGVPVHFCWVRDFEAFRMAELDCSLSAPSPGCVLLFDCWTPKIARDKGYYGTAIRSVASRIRGEGRAVWIFSAAENEASVRVIQRSGFRWRFALVRRRHLFGNRVARVDAPALEAMQMSAACAD